MIGMAKSLKDLGTSSAIHMMAPLAHPAGAVNNAPKYTSTSEGCAAIAPARTLIDRVEVLLVWFPLFCQVLRLVVPIRPYSFVPIRSSVCKQVRRFQPRCNILPVNVYNL